jgi:hypothetical protein
MDDDLARPAHHQLTKPAIDQSAGRLARTGPEQQHPYLLAAKRMGDADGSPGEARIADLESRERLPRPADFTVTITGCPRFKVGGVESTTCLFDMTSGGES